MAGFIRKRARATRTGAGVIALALLGAILLSGVIIVIILAVVVENLEQAERMGLMHGRWHDQKMTEDHR